MPAPRSTAPLIGLGPLPSTPPLSLAPAAGPPRDPERAEEIERRFREEADAATVIYVAAGEAARERAHRALDRAMRHLQRHGIKAREEEIPADDTAIADLLLSRAADLDADLLVMGAYGHSRVRELLLGGATRSILTSMTIPVLMSH